MKNQDLLKAATQAQALSHSPYSKARVGAALRLKDGSIITGCNIENASYGGTVCAERVALWKAVSEKGSSLQVQEILVVTDASPPWPPCGFCRQVMAEFCSADMVVHMAGPSGIHKSMSLADLLPESFSPANMKK